MSEPSPRQYAYVGPEDIRIAAITNPPGSSIHSSHELSAWLAANASDREPNDTLVATFVITCDGTLKLAHRRSEHVACASGGPVLSAGEITFSSNTTASSVEVVELTNQSTGFCPEPESWSSVAAALDRIAIARPDDFTTKVIFRRCPKCNERNIVKDEWFVCDLCDAELPKEWNFSS